jgi:hypothetical protein
VAASSESVFIATLYTSTLYLKYTHTRRRRSATARSSREFEPNSATGTRRARRVSITRERHTTHVTHERCTIHERGIHERYTRGTHERYSIHDRGFRGAQRTSRPDPLPTRAATRQPRPPSPSRLPLAAAPAHTRPTQRQHSASTAPAQRQHSARTAPAQSFSQVSRAAPVACDLRATYVPPQGTVYMPTPAAADACAARLRFSSMTGPKTSGCSRSSTSCAAAASRMLKQSMSS